MYIDIETFSPLLQSNDSTTTLATISNNFSGGGNASCNKVNVFNSSIKVEILP